MEAKQAGNGISRRPVQGLRLKNSKRSSKRQVSFSTVTEKPKGGRTNALCFLREVLLFNETQLTSDKTSKIRIFFGINLLRKPNFRRKIRILNMKKLKGNPLETLKNFRKKSHSAEKNREGRDTGFSIFYTIYKGELYNYNIYESC